MTKGHIDSKTLERNLEINVFFVIFDKNTEPKMVLSGRKIPVFPGQSGPVVVVWDIVGKVAVPFDPPVVVSHSV